MYIIIVMFRLIMNFKSLFHRRNRKLKKKSLAANDVRFVWNNFSLKMNIKKLFSNLLYLSFTVNHRCLKKSIQNDLDFYEVS